jgi:HPt (histidine-containing phosphotransfer) domain-containing protein
METDDQPSLDTVERLEYDIARQLRALQSPHAPGVVENLIDIYLNHSDKTVATIRAALTQGDAQQLASSAHALKGSSANMGAQGLAELCRELELAGRAGSMPDPEPQFERLQAEYQRVKAVMQRLRDGGLPRV